MKIDSYKAQQQEDLEVGDEVKGFFFPKRSRKKIIVFAIELLKM